MSTQDNRETDGFQRGREAGLAEAREYLRNWIDLNSRVLKKEVTLDKSLAAFSDAVDNLAELSGEGRFASAATKDGGGSSGPGTDEGDVYAPVIVKAER